MDDDIEDIREMAKKALALAEDTNQIVHRMRRSALWGRFFQVVWWIVILAVSGAAYYYYLEPYVDKLTQLYVQIEGTGQQTQNWAAELGQELSKLNPSR